jgi:hypothetical protein
VSYVPQQEDRECADLQRWNSPATLIHSETTFAGNAKVLGPLAGAKRELAGCGADSRPSRGLASAVPPLPRVDVKE